MAVSKVGVTTGNHRQVFQGLDTDTKPLSEGDYGVIGGLSMFFETNTGDVFVYDEVNINPSTGDGWWNPWS